MLAVLLQTIIYLLMLLFVLVYGLSPKLQKHNRVKYFYICIAIIVFLVTGYREYQNYQKYSYAYVSSSGEITKCKNFPWNVRKVSSTEKEVFFSIEDPEWDLRASAITIYPENKNLYYEVHKSNEGIDIQFKLNENVNTVSNFKIIIEE
ncbi:MAG: hypothetical protein JW709_04490 [Sedimentisphaerales bacterium]|nr:hypothetical protein [Sedimentisphaerales bacterium]